MYPLSLKPYSHPSRSPQSKEQPCYHISSSCGRGFTLRTCAGRDDSPPAPLFFLQLLSWLPDPAPHLCSSALPGKALPSPLGWVTLLLTDLSDSWQCLQGQCHSLYWLSATFQKLGCFLCMDSCDLHPFLLRQYYHWSHFTDGKTELQDSVKVAEPGFEPSAHAPPLHLCVSLSFHVSTR